MTKRGEATITGQGQVSIPVKVRQKLHLKKGDKIMFLEDEEGQIFLKEVESPVELSERDWEEFLSRTKKEPITKLKGKDAALHHLDKISAKK